MSKTVYMKRGSVEPSLVFTLSDADGEADFTVLGLDDFTIKGKQAGVLVVDGPPTTLTAGASNSEVVLTYKWQAGETDVVGLVEFEVVASWPGNRPQRFPADTFNRVQIVASLD